MHLPACYFQRNLEDLFYFCVQKLTCCPFCGTMDYFLNYTQKLTFFLSHFVGIEFKNTICFFFQINLEKEKKTKKNQERQPSF